MTLGTLPGVVGLGEVYKTLVDGPENMCLCGESSSNCQFWGNYFRSHYVKHDEISKKMEGVRELINRNYDRTHIIVDSSKCNPTSFVKGDRFRTLAMYLNDPTVQVRVIHLVRDYRSWIAGLLRRDANATPGIPSYSNSNIKSLLGKPRLRALQWYYGHRLIANFVRTNNLESITLSYEQLATRPNLVRRRIARWLGIDENFEHASISEFGKSLLSTKSHIIVGNPFRGKYPDSPEITYDTRWLTKHFAFLDLFPFEFFVSKYSSDLMKRTSDDLEIT